MTVAENVGFGLHERRVPKRGDRDARRGGAGVDAHGRVRRAPIDELSGGEQQRVALARALVVRPRCLLLDEPLSNLDAKLRQSMREEIRRLCKSAGLTTIYVTHDQKEALAIADRIAVMQKGRILQIGTPTEVYRRPRSRAVATFIGETNLFQGRVAAVDAGGVRVDSPIGAARRRGRRPDVLARGGQRRLDLDPTRVCPVERRGTRSDVARDVAAPSKRGARQRRRLPLPGRDRRAPPPRRRRVAHPLRAEPGARPMPRRTPSPSRWRPRTSCCCPDRTTGPTEAPASTRLALAALLAVLLLPFVARSRKTASADRHRARDADHHHRQQRVDPLRVRPRLPGPHGAARDANVDIDWRVAGRRRRDRAHSGVRVRGLVRAPLARGPSPPLDRARSRPASPDPRPRRRHRRRRRGAAGVPRLERRRRRRRPVRRRQPGVRQARRRRAARRLRASSRATPSCSDRAASRPRSAARPSGIATGRWVGACLSSFGICYNRDALARIGVIEPRRARGARSADPPSAASSRSPIRPRAGPAARRSR